MLRLFGVIAGAYRRVDRVGVVGMKTVSVPLADAILGKPCPSYQDGDSLIRQGLARFSGNQWNEAWSWEPKAVRALDDAAQQKLWGLLNR